MVSRDVTTSTILHLTITNSRRRKSFFSLSPAARRNRSSSSSRFVPIREMPDHSLSFRFGGGGRRLEGATAAAAAAASRRREEKSVGGGGEGCGLRLPRPPTRAPVHSGEDTAERCVQCAIGIATTTATFNAVSRERRKKVVK